MIDISAFMTHPFFFSFLITLLLWCPRFLKVNLFAKSLDTKINFLSIYLHKCFAKSFFSLPITKAVVRAAGTEKRQKSDTVPGVAHILSLNFTNLVLKWHFLYQVHMIRSQSMAVTLFIFPCQSTYSDWCPECQSVTQGSKYSDYLNCINYQRLFTLHKLSACNGIEIYQVQSN